MTSAPASSPRERIRGTLKLLRATVDGIAPIAGDEVRKQVIRWAVVQVAVAVRKRYLKHNPEVGSTKTRADVISDLESVAKSARKLGILLSKAVVRDALAQGVAGREFLARDLSETKRADDGPTEQKQIAYQSIIVEVEHAEKFLPILYKGADDAPTKALSALSTLAKGSIGVVGLRGKKGKATPWDQIEPSPKQLLARKAGQLWRAAKCTTRLPSHNNKPFKGFLNNLWELATGENLDDSEWEESIRIARRQKGKVRRETIIANLSDDDADELIEQINRREHYLRVRAGQDPDPLPMIQELEPDPGGAPPPTVTWEDPDPEVLKPSGPQDTKQHGGRWGFDRRDPPSDEK